MDLSAIACQEASPLSGETFVLCGRPGARVVFHQHDGRNVYVMCEACADHNVRNRGGVELTPKDRGVARMENWLITRIEAITPLAEQNTGASDVKWAYEKALEHLRGDKP